MPNTEEVVEELSKAECMDDLFDRDGIFANLFAETLEQMLEAELSDELGYERYVSKGRNSGNSRNGSYKKKVRSSASSACFGPFARRKIRFPEGRLRRIEYDLLHGYPPEILARVGRIIAETHDHLGFLYAERI